MGDLNLPASLLAAAERLASEDGVPLDSWIASAVAEKVGAVEKADGFLARRAAAGPADGLADLLRRVPGREPEDWDRLT